MTIDFLPLCNWLLYLLLYVDMLYKMLGPFKLFVFIWVAFELYNENWPVCTKLYISSDLHCVHIFKGAAHFSLCRPLTPIAGKFSPAVFCNAVVAMLCFFLPSSVYNAIIQSSSVRSFVQLSAFNRLVGTMAVAQEPLCFLLNELRSQ